MSGDLRDAVHRYVSLHQAASRPQTAESYGYRLSHLLRFLETRFPEIRWWREVRRRHMEEWVVALATRRPPLAASSRRLLLGAAKTFLRWLAESGTIDPALMLLGPRDLPRLEKILPKALSEAVDLRLIEQLRKSTSLRAKALLIMRFTGMRIGEFLALERNALVKTGDERWTMRVPVGKLHRDRIVPVGREVADLVAEVERLTAGSRRPCLSGTFERMFIVASGRPISEDSLREALAEECASAGIKERVWPHRLRHTYATDLVRRGMHFVAVKALLGHQSLEMTLRYVSMTQADVASAFHAAMAKNEGLYPALAAAVKSGCGAAGAEQPIADVMADLERRLRRLAHEAPTSRRKRHLHRIRESLTRLKARLQDD